jgi:phosphoserine phosphatase
LTPPRELLEHVGRLYVERATPEAGLVVTALHHLGKQVGVISGGLLQPVHTLARHLGIELQNVHAVGLTFDAAGRYVDFDRQSPLWRNGGKVEVLRALPASHRPCAFVGDGANDLETQGTVDRFIGYGGIAVRALVRERAEHWCATPSLAGILPLVLTAGEQEQLAGMPQFAPLLSRARA